MSNETAYLKEIAQNTSEIAQNTLPGGDGGGEGAATEATLSEVRDALGTKEDETANSLFDYSGRADWSFVSLLRGIFNKLEYLINGYVTLFVNIAYPVQTYPASNPVTDFSGTIESPNVSFEAIENPNHKWLLLQNLGKLNSETGLYEGDLWINIGYPYDSNLGQYVSPVASTEHGSYRLKPGDTLNFQGSIIPFGKVALLGTIAGLQYTLKKA